MKNKVVIKYQGETAPKYHSKGASGFDITSSETLWLHPKKTVVVPTGLRVELPEGLELQIRARSGFSKRHDVIIKNGIGTIDSDYRGEIGIIFFNIGKKSVLIKKGDRIAQGILCSVKRGEFELGELTSTERGEKGFGSTGR